MIPPHDHELDGNLHEGCEMCNEIQRRRGLAKLDAGVDKTTTHYAKIADRTNDPRPVVEL